MAGVFSASREQAFLSRKAYRKWKANRESAGWQIPIAKSSTIWVEPVRSAKRAIRSAVWYVIGIRTWNTNTLRLTVQNGTKGHVSTVTRAGLSKKPMGFVLKTHDGLRALYMFNVCRIIQINISLLLTQSRIASRMPWTTHTHLSVPSVYPT